MSDLDALREEAQRTWRLAADCTDMKLKAELTTYVLEIEDRVRRMEAALKSNETLSQKVTQ